MSLDRYAGLKYSICKICYMEKGISDIAYDRKALKGLLRTMIEDLRQRNIQKENVVHHYCNPLMLEFEYDSELRECMMGVRWINSEIFQLFLQVRDTARWKTKECLIEESRNLDRVLQRLDDVNLIDKLYAEIYLWEEGVVEDRVVIPKGIARIGPMILDPNGRRWREKNGIHSEEFPLCQYGRIGTLVIPDSVDIPHDDRYSPFASYRQRGFVCNHPTEWQKIHIRDIENHSPHLSVEDGVLYSADKSRLIYCFGEKSSFVIPQSVTTIEPYAFCLQKGLKEVVFHDDVTFIGDAAFMACSALEEVMIPKRIRHIADDCFDGCVSLRRITLPEGLEGIGHCAFRQCRALREIHLPDSITYVKGFEGCSALQEIEIPAGVERIEGFMFCDSLRKVVLHEGVRRIDGYAFRYCNNLSEINFPEGLEYIGERAFYPAALERLVFPGSLREIGCEAFYHNSKLRYVEFGSDVPKIAQAAFACCPLRSIRRPDDMEIKDDVFVQDTTLDKFAFWD